jgi:cytochrome b
MRQYLGHNPLGRLSVTILLMLMVVQATTGLVLAGTDLFYPPLGGWIAGKVAAPGVDPVMLVPYAPALYDAAAYAAMRSWRAPIVAIHGYVFYTLLVVAVIHLLGVVATELREGGNLVSAMLTGKKILKAPPADLEQMK